MSEEPTLHDLFDQWNTLIERETADPSLIPPRNSIPYDYQHPPTFAEFLATLTPHLREKAKVMHAILTRLNAHDPEGWVRSQIRENIPQLAYFLLKRHIELFILQNDFGIREVSDDFRQHNQAPLAKLDVATRLQLNGANYAELLEFARDMAEYTLQKLIGVTDGGARYGDLPENAPRPRLVAEHGRLLNGLHEYMEDTVLQPPQQDEQV